MKKLSALPLYPLRILLPRMDCCPTLAVIWPMFSDDPLAPALLMMTPLLSIWKYWSAMSPATSRARESSFMMYISSDSSIDWPGRRSREPFRKLSMYSSTFSSALAMAREIFSLTAAGVCSSSIAYVNPRRSMNLSRSLVTALRNRRASSAP